MKFGDYIVLPTSVVDKHRRTSDKARVRRARWEAKANRGTSHGKGKGTHHEPGQFVFWDGEGPQDAGYALFGNSEGFDICHPHLGTLECLELILETETAIPTAIHVGYGFNYDVSMILKDLPWRHLAALHKYTRTVWRDFELEHIPHKWFKVKRGGIVATIYDIRSFFAGAFLNALLAFGIGTEDDRNEIQQEKQRRGDFRFAEIKRIRHYWAIELRLGALLAEKLRTVFGDAGYVPRSWHGPGALARMALLRHKVYDAMAESPIDVRIAAQYAFAGGRFELFKAGHVQGKIYNADKRSAYPAFAKCLPNLARGKWRRTRVYEPNKFAVYHISYSAKPDAYRPYPLFRRMASGEIAWPHRVEGWYWSPEAALVADDADAKFIEGWVFDEDDATDRPFAWIEEYYRKRQVLKNAGNPAEYTFKLIINSVYGQLAQRAGWNRKSRTAPRSHQLEWAGFITSACRAEIYNAARCCGDKLVSIDTDGIASLAPINGMDVGNALGQWELEEYGDGVFWQSGMYCLREDLGYDPALGYGWIKAKARGIPKGSYSAEELIEYTKTGEAVKLSKKVFVTYGLADSGRRELHNQWVSEPHSFIMGGSGKRMHFPLACKSQCGQLHALGSVVTRYGPAGDPMSRRHHLPWQDPPDDTKAMFDDLTFFDANDLDMDDEWVRDYESV